MQPPDETAPRPPAAREEAAEAVRGGHYSLAVALALVSIAEDVRAIRRVAEAEARKVRRG